MGGTDKGVSLGDLLDGIATVVDPEAPALIHGDRTITWGQTDKRTNNMARQMLARGIEVGDKAAIYMRNRPEYMEAVSATFKSRTVHVNVNFRYTPEEVIYIFDNSDATVVFFATEFIPQMEELRSKLTKVKLFVEVTPEGEAPQFDGAVSLKSSQTMAMVHRSELNARAMICSSFIPAAQPVCPRA